MRRRVFDGLVALSLFFGAGCGSNDPQNDDELSGGAAAGSGPGTTGGSSGADAVSSTAPAESGSTGGETGGSDGGSTTEGVPPGDDHTHFDTECAKPGVVGCRSWRVQSEIDEDVHSNMNAVQPGDPNYPVYDPEADGARSSVLDGYGLTNLRYSFPHTTGSVWVQYEMRIDAVVFADPIFSGLTMKLWRVEDDTKAECNDARRITHNIFLGYESHVYHRDGCGLGEVEFDDGTELDRQPGGDSQCLYGADEPHPDCFRWQGDTWIRFTYHFDFAGQMLHIWAYRADDDGPTKIVEYPVESWTADWGMDTAGVWTHSTSRGHGNWPVVPEFGIYGRNEIISTEGITR